MGKILRNEINGTSSKDSTKTAATTGGTEENQKQTTNDGSGDDGDDTEDHPYFILFIRRLNIDANSEMKISKSFTIGVSVSFKMYPTVRIIQNGRKFRMIVHRNAMEEAKRRSGGNFVGSCVRREIISDNCTTQAWKM